ncbi:MAG: NUDIX hydrolase [bacterium]
MYFNHSMIRAAEEKYGTPKTLRLNYPTPKKHYDFIRSTQKNGRAHDVTLYLYHDNKLAVTQKPVYPEGSYRPPSGGLNPGETLEEGALREGFEELGINITLDNYLLRVRVDFVYGAKRIAWTTHLFQVKYKGAGPPRLDPRDRHEISAAAWADEHDFFYRMRPGLLSVDSTGLLYRVHLHDYVWRQFGWGDVK